MQEMPRQKVICATFPSNSDTLNTPLNRVTILDHCASFLRERKAEIDKQLRDLEESLGSESKSTAGDKHDTARAMTHLEQEKLGRRELLLSKEIHLLSKITNESVPNTVELGSVVYLDRLTFFLGPSMGKIEVEGQQVMVISPSAPISQAMLGKKKGDTFTFNGIQREIVALD